VHRCSSALLVNGYRCRIMVCVPTWCPVRARVSHAGEAAPSVSFFFRHASTALLLSAPLACKASNTTRSKQPWAPGSDASTAQRSTGAAISTKPQSVVTRRV
jgi:hypothetical protein